MAESQLHVVFGTGQVESALAAAIAATVSWYRTRPSTS